MATLDRQELFRLARLGAEARLRALEDERAQILRSFPGLKAGSTPAAQSGAAAAAPARRRRQMSAAERRSVSIRMKKYWAERRREKAKRD
jgi:hypothetical protein